ncbi:heavy metal sensor histidine kinase [Luteimonas aquatica]|uniref:heavy metal sensor histidine kinase n=1 Tax=Luteimonas aquatica TaxID=450364 RepID=UPI001F5A0329|nr:heavy metal sensor histidine kinase [Luteimonas aquatica]
MSKSPSLAMRIMRAQTLATALLLSATGVAIFMFQKHQMDAQQSAELSTRLQIIRPIVEHADRPRRFALLKDKLASFTPADDRLRFIVDSPDPRVAYGKPFPADARTRRLPDGSFYVHFDGRTFRAVETIVPASGERPAVRLTAALDHEPVHRAYLVLGLGIGVISLLAIAIVGILGRTIVRSGLRPLVALSHHAAGLNPNDPEALLPLDGLPEEVREMTTAFNGALERLHETNARMSAFNADVAHELRTPLSNMIGQTQVVLSRERPAGELREVLHSNLEELERMQSIVNDMLFLARADRGAIVDNLAASSIAEIARRSADLFEDALEEAGLSLRIDGDVVAAVEPSLLGRAIANLIDNAIRHGAGAGQLLVQIRREGDEAEIGVRNPADASAAQRIDRWFDRFFRLDSARQREGGSHGLGLAIVKAVAAMHGGSVAARHLAGAGEIEVLLRLPIASAAPSSAETAREGAAGSRPASGALAGE